jgi:hypothetical protein
MSQTTVVFYSSEDDMNNKISKYGTDVVYIDNSTKTQILTVLQLQNVETISYSTSTGVSMTFNEEKI